MKYKTWKEELLSWIFPRRCPVCDDIVVPKGALICAACDLRMRRIKEPVCKKCGKQIKDARKEYCRDCKERKHEFKAGAAVFVYNDSVRQSIYKYKYRARREYADYYAKEIEKALHEKIQAWHADALIPVPLYAVKKRKRGFNQAEILAKKLGRALDITVDTKIITRCRKTRPQKELNVEQRQNNLKKAFKTRGNDVKLKTVIIIDDIYTTGSTIDAMASVLKNIGIKNVYFISLAIGEEA